MPPVTLALLVGNLVVFLLQLAGGLPLFEWFALWPPALSRPRRSGSMRAGERSGSHTGSFDPEAQETSRRSATGNRFMEPL